MRLTNNIGFIFLAIFLILVALPTLVPGLPIPPVITAIVALISAVFILIGR